MELLDYTASKVEELLAAPSASAQTKENAQAWKDAIAAGGDADAACLDGEDLVDRLVRKAARPLRPHLVDELDIHLVVEEGGYLEHAFHLHNTVAQDALFQLLHGSPSLL